MNGPELERLRRELAPLPAHVGIIMDGNGRWAAERGLPRSMGHRAGTERLRGVIRLTSDLGIGSLSLYAFSTENWKRPAWEVQALFGLFMEFFVNEVEELHQNGVRILAMGDVDGLPENVASACRAAMEKTKRNPGLKLNIGLNYGGMAETLRAVRALAREAACDRLDPEKIDEAALTGRLYTAGQPEVDLVLRTGGEMRLSNFMPLQSVYAELAFPKVYWPDFTDECYLAALRDFSRRNRRYGGLDGE